MSITSDFAKKFFATRIGGEHFAENIQTYKFEKIKIAKREAFAKFPTRILIDMGVGEPDKMACDATIDTLAIEARKFENRGYADNGCMEFKEAAAKHMYSQFGVSFNPVTEVVHSIGSKSALSLLSYCFVNPGDVILMTVPGYPVFGTHAKYLMGDVIGLPLYAKNNFLPDLNDLSTDVLKKTKVLVVNYPNNPTGACATKEFFKKIVEYAHEHEILIINDAAYADLTYSDTDRISIFNIDGAKDVAIELHSMSKGFNMTGWRLGWVCGNENLMTAYAHVKDQSDSGQFLAIQKAAAQALNNNSFFPSTNARRYSERMDKIVTILKDCGFDAIPSKAGFFLYVKIPSEAEYNGNRIRFLLAEEFADWMIRELGIVVVPWDDVEPAIRFSMTFGMKDMEESDIINLFRERMLGVRFRFGKRR